jgi:DNA repair exonuclease SbcCD ATPase subunit
VTDPSDSAERFIRQANDALQVLRKRVDAAERLRASHLGFEQLNKIFTEQGGKDEISRLDDLVKVKSKSALADLVEIEKLDGSIERQDKVESQDAGWSDLIEAGQRIGLQTGHCPLCGSDVTPKQFADHIAMIRESLSVQIQDRGEVRKKRVVLKSKRDRDLVEVVIANGRLADLRSRQQQIDVEEKRIQKERAEILGENNLSGLQGIFSELTTSIGELTGIIEGILSMNSLSEIVQLEREIASAEKDVNAAKARYDMAHGAATHLKEIYDAARLASNDILNDRMSSNLPLLKELYERLQPHAAYRDVDVRLRGGVRGFLSFTVGEDVNPKFVYSSGQCRALGLSFLLGVNLALQGSKLRTLILDDPIQHIDDYRALHLVEVLSAVRKTGRQVICAVEDDQIAELLSRRLSVDGQRGRRIELAFSVDRGVHIESEIAIESLPARALLTA